MFEAPAPAEVLTLVQSTMQIHSPSQLGCCCAGAQPALAKLYRTIEVQVSHQAALSSLAGRLDLLCAQIPAASGAQDVVYQPQVGLLHVSEHCALSDNSGMGSHVGHEQMPAAPRGLRGTVMDLCWPVP